MPYTVSSELIWQDKQHEVLFELIDEIKREDADLGIFAKLTEYAENHFCLEEEYMVRLNYPAAKEHIMAHDKFRVELQGLVTLGGEYDENVNNSLSLFLSEWLKRHVFGLDKRLERFVMESDFK